MDESSEFLMEYFGRHFFPEMTEPEQVLCAPCPLFGLVKPTAPRGVKDLKGVSLLISAEGVEMDIRPGMIYTNAEAMSKTTKSGHQKMAVHEILPRILQTSDRAWNEIPIRIRVWSSEDIPEKIQERYAGLPYAFCTGPYDAVSISGARVSRNIFEKAVLFARDGQPYLLFISAPSPANLLPHLRVFRGQIGVSTQNGTAFYSARKESLLAQLSAYPPSFVFVYRVWMALQRTDGRLPDKAPALDGKKGALSAWWKQAQHFHRVMSETGGNQRQALLDGLRNGLLKAVGDASGVITELHERFGCEAVLTETDWTSVFLASIQDEEES